MSARMWPGILAVVLAMGGVASAETYRHGRVLEAEAGVVIQSAGEAGSDEASPNMPFLPGDRVWTAGEGRVEFQFADGTLVRLDARSKLDYVSYDEDRVVLRLWSGSAYVQTRHVRSGRPDVGLETPAAVIESRGRGLYRVDVRNGDTRVSVLEGSVDVQGDGGTESLRRGERTFVHRGDAPESAERFDARNDPFDRWNEQRDGQTSWADADSEYLPDDLDPYASDLDPYGRWVREPEYGFVWVPVVHSAWSPYSTGRWAWTPYGWTWIPVERWGWVTSHYGRWDYRPSIGWCWAPRSGWSGAWVSWAYNDRYVGWSPLGYHDRPVVIREDRSPRHVGNAVPRWNVVPREELGRGRAVAVARPPQHVLEDMKALEGPMAQPDREARGVRTGQAVPRNVSTRPGPGDTVPELRTDPKYTIPFPTARRTPRGEDRERTPAPNDSWTTGRTRQTGGAVRQDAGSEPAARTSAPPAERTRAPRPAPVEAAPAPRPAPREEATPRARPRIDKGEDRSDVGVPMAFFAAEEKPPTPKPRDRETDRDVLKRLFRPAEQGRDRDKARKRGDDDRPPLVHQTPRPDDRKPRKKKDDDQ